MTVADVLEMIGNLKRGKIKFELRLSPVERSMSLSALDLTPRAFNALNNGGIHTLGDLQDRMQSSEDLIGIRSLGEKSRKEVITLLLAYAINRNIENDNLPLEGIAVM